MLCLHLRVNMSEPVLSGLGPATSSSPNSIAQFSICITAALTACGKYRLHSVTLCPMYNALTLCIVYNAQGQCMHRWHAKMVCLASMFWKH